MIRSGLKYLQLFLDKKNGDPPATRTRDTLIKSQVLYRLS